MRILYYMGRNSANKTGVSWKIWKIERKSRTVFRYWGSAVVEKRKVVPKGKLQLKKILLPSVTEAEVFVKGCIQKKLAKGYERRTRRT